MLDLPECKSHLKGPIPEVFFPGSGRLFRWIFCKLRRQFGIFPMEISIE